MISPEYLEQNRQLHETVPEYGKGGTRRLDRTLALCELLDAKTILDYGCGKGALVKALREAGYDARGYDPAIDAYSGTPEPADVVICTDVLEHIEPERLGAVLDDMQRLAKKGAYLLVSTSVAKKTLPDGRNAHLIVKHSNWWLFHLMKRFLLLEFVSGDRGFEAFLGK